MVIESVIGTYLSVAFIAGSTGYLSQWSSALVALLIERGILLLAPPRFHFDVGDAGDSDEAEPAIGINLWLRRINGASDDSQAMLALD